MYYLVKYKKPAKHLIGAKNKVLARKGGFDTLLEAERMLYVSATSLKRAPDEGFRLDDAVRGESLEYFNPTNGYFYVKTNKYNDYGKKMYQTYSPQQYKRWISNKKRNPFTQII